MNLILPDRFWYRIFVIRKTIIQSSCSVNSELQLPEPIQISAIPAEIAQAQSGTTNES